MTALFTDNFNRANSTGISNANWTTATGANASVNIVSNEAACIVGDICSNYINSIVWPNDQYAKCSVGTVVETVTDNGVGPMVRMAAGAQTGYLGQGNTHETKLYKAVATAFTQLGINGPAVTTGDVLELRAQGTTLTLLLNGTAICGTPLTDASIAAGNAGIWLSSPGQQDSLDNFEAGDFSTPPVTTSLNSPPLPPAMGSKVLGPLGIEGFAFRTFVKPTANITAALTGQSATFTPGTVAPGTAVSFVGIAVFTAAGTLSPSTAVALTGQAGLFATGLVVPNSSVALTGSSATFGSGNLLAASTLALTGVSSAFTAGQLVPATTVSLQGAAVISSAGTMSVTNDVTVALTGSRATFTPGTLTSSGGTPSATQPPVAGWPNNFGTFLVKQ